ncbi:MAG TPA: ECF-type sigma factor [Polyangiales bacterium]|nr:ECF-type sigma factor [Polyangiales bacterium]
MEATIGSLIASADDGDGVAAADLFTRLYADLQRLARRELARGADRAAIGVNSLLHEAYLIMQRAEGAAQFPDRARFLSYASKVMRSLIIDHARRRGAQKRGRNFELITLEPDRAIPAEALDAEHLEELGRALQELEKVDPVLAELVDLKYFCGISLREIAAMNDLSERTLQRRWDKARLILHHTLKSP